VPQPSPTTLQKAERFDVARPTIDHVLACPTLPSLPGVALRVLELARDDSASAADIAATIQHDSALCARILKTVNSPFYGLTQPCTTINRAITFLGMNTVKSLVLGFSLVSLTDQKQHGFDLVRHWRRAMYSASAARRFALMTGACDPDEAFIAGIMQDIGVVALYAALKADYAEIAAQAGERHERLPQAERDALGFDHAEVGAALAERWRLPPALVSSIRHHHLVDAAGTNPMARVAALGSHVAEALDAEDPTEPLERLNRDGEHWFRLPAGTLNAVIQEIVHGAAEVANCFGVDTGAWPDVNAILAQAEEVSLEHHLRVQRETERLRTEYARLSEQALTDGLTGLGNRQCFDRELAASFEQAWRQGGRLTIALFDADHFKKLNDTLGHQAGDAVLIEISNRIRLAIGTAGLVCRYGGEEIVAIMPGTGRVEAAALVDAARRSVAAHVVELRNVPGEAESASVTVSVGVAVLEPASAHIFTRPALLLEAADRSLYAAKNAGRNCVRIFMPRPRDASTAAARAA
jgi:two-component system, cell cycle response regulator